MFKMIIDGVDRIMGMISDGLVKDTEINIHHYPLQQSSPVWAKWKFKFPHIFP